MERNERKANSRNHSLTVDRESKFLLRKIIFDFAILFCGKFFTIPYIFNVYLILYLYIYYFYAADKYNIFISVPNGQVFKIKIIIK